MMNDSYFKPLQNMQAFTEDMFNRIISFQEKEHPAWDSSLAFEQRIKNLPLHNLIFSSPDRDPLKFGPTVASFYPLREEMQKIAYYVNQVNASSLCDIYCGNGFISSLIAREGVEVYGITDDTIKPNQISEFYDANCFRLTSQSGAVTGCPAVLAPWMPSNLNPTPRILQHKPRLIIYIYSNHINEKTNTRQTGSNDMFDALEINYKLIDQWSVTRPQNILHDIWPDMTPNIEETRHTRIYVHTEYQNITKVQNLPSVDVYDWENDLKMALLALEAKQQIEDRGFIV